MKNIISLILLVFIVKSGEVSGQEYTIGAGLSFLKSAEDRGFVFKENDASGLMERSRPTGIILQRREKGRGGEGEMRRKGEKGKGRNYLDSEVFRSVLSITLYTG